jgi:hypothetical protein
MGIESLRKLLTKGELSGQVAGARGGAEGLEPEFLGSASVCPSIP